ncbi:MAG: flagellar export chaperone FliS [Edaphobacter sp.]|uniref:flagellar export chaperone FliS n=1 Tax=Edaphobacter sp. TaxID=1934404 RepID=UPI00238DD731|nr:flagellar export chaperone FliS [Edaphobacter sp.]MDE1175626.1 flagellar export chaperone FliS [Edaphobacter sp.]
MSGYREQSLTGATGVELVLALYNGLIRFLLHARACVVEGDVRGRRLSVKRALDIVMYLQARLRMDLGGETAVALNDFYVAAFTLILEASQAASLEKMDEVIQCVRGVREAWVIVARDPKAGRVLPQDLRRGESALLLSSEEPFVERTSAGWSA